MASRSNHLPLAEQPQYTTKVEKTKNLFLATYLLCMFAWLGCVVGTFFTGENGWIWQHVPMMNMFMGGLCSYIIAGILFSIEEAQGEQYIVPPREQWGNCTYWRVLDGGKVVPAQPGLQCKENLFSIMSSQTFVFKSVLRNLGQSLVLQNHKVKVVVPLDSTNETQRADLVAQVVSWWSRFCDAYKNPQTDRMAHQLNAEAKRTDLPFTIEILPDEQPFKAA